MNHSHNRRMKVSRQNPLSPVLASGHQLLLSINLLSSFLVGDSGLRMTRGLLSQAVTHSAGYTFMSRRRR